MKKMMKNTPHLMTALMVSHHNFNFNSNFSYDSDQCVISFATSHLLMHLCCIQPHLHPRISFLGSNNSMTHPYQVDT